MQEQLDLFKANQTWELIYKREIGPSHKSLIKNKWVYKVKLDINEDIA